MCANQTCPLSKKCYRKTAMASQWQSNVVFKWKKENGKVICEDFIPNGNQTS